MGMIVTMRLTLFMTMVSMCLVTVCPMCTVRIVPACAMVMPVAMAPTMQVIAMRMAARVIVAVTGQFIFAVQTGDRHTDVAAWRHPRQANTALIRVGIRAAYPTLAPIWNTIVVGAAARSPVPVAPRTSASPSNPSSGTAVGILLSMTLTTPPIDHPP